VSAERCQVRDRRGFRCTIEGEHRTIVNSKGQQATAHETKTSMWSVPTSDFVVVGQARQDDAAFGRMLRTANEETNR
jgi:hypothetical protein